MSTPATRSPEPTATPALHPPGWLWATCAAFGAVSALWSVVQAAEHHPTGLVGALIPPGILVLAFLAGLWLQLRPTPVFAGAGWRVLLWLFLFFCLVQVGHGAWEETGSRVAVLLSCAVTLGLVPALVLVSHTLRSLGRAE